MQDTAESQLSFHDSDFPALGGAISRAPQGDLPRRGSTHESLANGEGTGDRGDRGASGGDLYSSLLHKASAEGARRMQAAHSGPAASAWDLCLVVISGRQAPGVRPGQGVLGYGSGTRGWHEKNAGV